jgi:hypothetical protein
MKPVSISIAIRKDDKAYVADVSSWKGSIRRGDHYSKVIPCTTVDELIAKVNEQVENVIMHFHNKELAKKDM